MKNEKRKTAIINHFNKLASARDTWINKNRFFFESDLAYLKFIIPKDSKVLELGCGTGHVLSSLKPSVGVGIDISPEMIREAKERYSEYEFINGDIENENTYKDLNENFDFILISDTLGYLSDCQEFFSVIRNICTPNTRIVISYHSWIWEPILRLSELIGLKMPQTELNWFSKDDIKTFMNLGNIEIISQDKRILLPVNLAWAGKILNKYIASLPIINSMCIRNYIVTRVTPPCNNTHENQSVSVIIPCKNEEGNIEAAIKRMPDFETDTEILFIEGNSSDNTKNEIKRIIEKYNNKKIKFFTQEGKGKGNAVRLGFEKANGAILMILDGDLTVPPEELVKFYKAIITRKGEFINGTRLIYPMDKEAMRFLNYWANRTFSWLFTWLLHQNYTDTLCGTKVITKQHYMELLKNKSYFGDFDPFGDFDLIFGAYKLNLKTLEIPIRYASREYGETQISRFRHGFMLLKMVVFAYKKLRCL